MLLISGRALLSCAGRMGGGGGGFFCVRRRSILCQAGRFLWTSLSQIVPFPTRFHRVGQDFTLYDEALVNVVEFYAVPLGLASFFFFFFVAMAFTENNFDLITRRWTARASRESGHHCALVHGKLLLSLSSDKATSSNSLSRRCS